MQTKTPAKALLLLNSAKNAQNVTPNDMYRYSLDRSSKKFTCPNCSKKRFVRYVDNSNNNYLNLKVGKCDREINCGFHYSPKMFFNDIGDLYEPYVFNQVLYKKKNIDYHTSTDLNETLNADLNSNNFLKFLFSNFKKSEVDLMLLSYKIGTANNYYNGTVFWQIDYKNNIRAGKIISYNNEGKRTQFTNWVHAIKIKKGQLKKFELSQCLFGEHLINKYDKPIAIVESEKTACVMSILFKKYLWLATGGLHGISNSKLSPIKKRQIILYPDLGVKSKRGSPFDIWNQKRYELLKQGYQISISDLLEKNATKKERENGLDIADYFLQSKPTKELVFKSKKESHLEHLTKINITLPLLISKFDLKINE